MYQVLVLKQKQECNISKWTGTSHEKNHLSIISTIILFYIRTGSPRKNGEATAVFCDIWYYHTGVFWDIWYYHIKTHVLTIIHFFGINIEYFSSKQKIQ